jgi:hypothetical protein
MGYTSTNVSVGTVATKVVSGDSNYQKVWFHNHEHANNHEIFLGGSGVTTTTGFHLQHTETFMMDIPPGDELWALADGASRDLRIVTWRQ